MGRNILKAAVNDTNVNFRETETGLDRVLLKYFLRGIKSDIRVRLIPSVSFDETIREAIIVEREVCFYRKSEPSEATSSVKTIFSNIEDQNLQTRVGIDSEKRPICFYCRKRGHLIRECRKRMFDEQRRKERKLKSETQNLINI